MKIKNGSNGRKGKIPEGKGRVEEKLRGRIRELEKALDQQSRTISSLEKQLANTPYKPRREKQKEVEVKTNENLCPSCKKGELQATSFWHPKTGDTTQLTCNECGHCATKIRTVG